MHIQTLTSSFSERYEAFLLSRPETLLYQSWKYQTLLINLLDCKQQGLLALDENENILAALPLLAKDGPFGTILNSLPFYGSNGAVIGENPAARAALATAYHRLLQSQGMAASTLIENPLAPGGADGMEYNLTDERIGQFTHLPFEHDKKAALMHSFHYKTRNMIRKAEKLGIDVVVDNGAMTFLIAIHEENMREIGGLAKPRRFFDELPRHFSPGQDYQLYLAKLNDEPVAAVLVFFYNRTVEYYTPVVRKEYRDSQALSAAIFQAMCDAAHQGYEWWNWGGTWLSQDGVYRFKSRWGTDDRHYRYFTSVQNPAILKASSAELLEAYSSFFTVPFTALSNSEDD